MVWFGCAACINYEMNIRAICRYERRDTGGISIFFISVNRIELLAAEWYCGQNPYREEGQCCLSVKCDLLIKLCFYRKLFAIELSLTKGPRQAIESQLAEVKVVILKKNGDGRKKA